MTFTRVFRSIQKGEKDNAWVSNSKWQKNSTKIVKKATKSKQQDVCPSRKRQMSKVERRRIDSQGYPARETQRKNPETTILEGLLAKGGLALCFQRQGVL